MDGFVLGLLYLTMGRLENMTTQTIYCADRILYSTPWQKMQALFDLKIKHILKDFCICCAYVLVS